jgi:hypothetical protein
MIISIIAFAGLDLLLLIAFIITLTNKGLTFQPKLVTGLLLLFAVASGIWYNYDKYQQGKKPSCYPSLYPNVTNFKINSDKLTPKGVKVDTSGFSLDLGMLDKRIDEMESCIKQVINEIKPTPEELTKWGCSNAVFSPTFKRECITIKLTKPLKSKCSDWSLLAKDESGLPALAPDSGCQEKGIVPTKECPCTWRIAIQDGNTIVTPALDAEIMYLWDLGRLHTGCQNIWYSPFAKCLHNVIK